MAAATKRGEIPAAERSSSRSRITEASLLGATIQTDMDSGPEDVIRWPPLLLLDTAADGSAEEEEQEDYVAEMHHLRLQRAASRLLSSSSAAVESPGGSEKVIVNGRRRSPSNCCRNCSSSSTTSPFLATALLCTYLMLSSPAGVAEASRQDVGGSNCTFPQRWEGTWFQSGLQQPIVIKGSKLSFRGTCIASDGDKFLMADDKCRRCVVIYEKHKNVLQYKESECDDMYMDQSNHPVSNPLPIRTMQKSSELNNNHNSNSRGGAHPNTNGGHSRSSSDQYLFRSNDDIDNCPLGFCRGRESLQNLCEQIPGDALLYSMFKENAEPVKCPLKGPFTFTYNRGHGECKDPVSNIESCTEESRLLLSFQPCADVAGTESTVEELTCLATWKDGNSRYLVGLVSHHHATSNEERYRCFVYEKVAGGSKEAEYKLAQSGDATCNGLDSAEVGSRIMTLRKAPAADRCDFPQWFKTRKHWHSILGNYGYSFHSSDGSMHITRSNQVLETRALCEQINKQTSNEMMAVVHYTTGCQSGFMCMMFYRRDSHVAEIQMGSPAMRLEDACAPDHFDINKLQFVTLLAMNPESEVCPIDGLYGLRGAIGPPYIPSRHKRNHNQRNHSVPGAQQQQQQQKYRRHSNPLSFRSSSTGGGVGGATEQLARHSWKNPTRGLEVRNRRDTTEVMERANHHQQQQREERDEMRVRRDTAGCVVNYSARRQLLVGCTKTNVIEVRPFCTEDNDEVYTCHGSWSHNGTWFIVAKHVGSQHGVCMSYRPQEQGSAQLVIGDVCLRSQQSPMEHHLVANLTVHDHTGMDREAKCSSTNGAKMVLATSTSTLLLVFVALVLER